MNFNDKIYISGHTGLVGSAIIRELKFRGFSNILTRKHSELDLTNQSHVKDFFKKEKPKYVILAAAKVGGIHANATFPAEFIYTNIMIEANVINASYENHVKRLLFLGSTCIYPKLSEQPMREESLLKGYLESTNEPYAVAKIAGIKLCESYNRQYGTDFRSVMPTNLYGVNDNFHSENSHVVPALISRFYEAKAKNATEVVVWGSGKVKRDFLYVDDMANAALFVFALSKDIYQLNTKPMLSHINIGTGKDITIYELAKTIKKAVGFNGVIKFDSDKPDGAIRKLVDTSKLSNMGWTYSIELEDGIEKTCDWYIKLKESSVL
ncbi:GDP-L-fucose synthase [Candidatus Thioglobus sp.]|nr:GDP-L-fucose synthase [Candidatus Thioglobus sp.]